MVSGGKKSKPASEKLNYLSPKTLISCRCLLMQYAFVTAMLSHIVSFLLMLIAF